MPTRSLWMRFGTLVVALAVFAACGTETPVTVREHLPPFVAALRPDQPGFNESFRFDVGDTVESYDSVGGGFRLHYARTGRNAVSATDVDVSGVPDFVEDAATIYDGVLSFYRDALGFLPPLSDDSITDNGGDGRFDVYLVDFGGGGADGVFRTDASLVSNPDQCIGYMVQENDFVGYGYPSTHIATQILASHELFHAVQAAYDANQGAVLSEGTATWATEQYDSSLRDFESAVRGYFDNPDHPLDVPMAGPVDAFSYGTAIYFEFLSERFDPTMVRSLWERVVNDANGEADPNWFAVLPGVLNDAGADSFAETWVQFATWNLYTGAFADPTQSYARGADYPRVRVDVVAAPWQDAALRVSHAATEYYSLAPEGRSDMTAALVGPVEELLDLHLVLAVGLGSSYDPVLVVSDITAGTETVPTASARNLVVAVVNASTGTMSRHPGICVGTVDEVAACRNELVPTQAGPTESTNGQGGCDCAASISIPAALICMLMMLRRRKPGAARMTVSLVCSIDRVAQLAASSSHRHRKNASLGEALLQQRHKRR